MILMRPLAAVVSLTTISYWRTWGRCNLLQCVLFVAQIFTVKKYGLSKLQQQNMLCIQYIAAMANLLDLMYQKFEKCLTWLCWHVRPSPTPSKRETYSFYIHLFKITQSNCVWSPGSAAFHLPLGSVLFLLLALCGLPNSAPGLTILHSWSGFRECSFTVSAAFKNYSKTYSILTMVF